MDVSDSAFPVSPPISQWPPHEPDAVTPPTGRPEGLWQDQGHSPDTIDDNASEFPGPGVRARQAFEERYPAEGFDQM